MAKRRQPNNETTLGRAIVARGFEVTKVCEAAIPYLEGEPTKMTVYNRIHGKSSLTPEKFKELMQAINKVIEDVNHPITPAEVSYNINTIRII